MRQKMIMSLGFVFLLMVSLSEARGPQNTSPSKKQPLLIPTRPLWNPNDYVVHPIPPIPPVSKRRALNYYHDVKPIMDARCTSCHGRGGIMASMPWDNYSNIYSHRDQIQNAVVEKRMPPWPPSSECGPRYQNDFSLTPEQIETIREWVATGALEGNVAEAGAPLSPVTHTTLSRVDQVLTVPPYIPSRPEEYRCFVIDWSGATDQFITGMQVDPGLVEVVHHALIYKITGDPVDPDYDSFFRRLDDADPGLGFSCTAGTGVVRLSLLGAWAPGNQGTDYPEGTGLPIAAHTKVMVQIHYNRGSYSPAWIGSRIGDHPIRLNFRTAAAVAHPAEMRNLLNPSWISDPMTMRIPAHSLDTYYSHASFVSGTIYGLAAHQHLLGTSNRFKKIHYSSAGERTESCLLDIPRWDFHWQDVYWFQEPMRFGSADSLEIGCHWRNDSDRDAFWGDFTTDEMCLGYVYYVPDAE